MTGALPDTGQLAEAACGVRNPEYPSVPRLFAAFAMGRVINPKTGRSQLLGEVGIVGTAAAIANGVYDATGASIRDLPIRRTKLPSYAPLGGPAPVFEVAKPTARHPGAKPWSALRLADFHTVASWAVAYALRLSAGLTLRMVMPPEQFSQEVSDPSLTSPAVSAWRTRHLVALMLVALLVLAMLMLVAGQANPNAVDLGATRWIQRFKDPGFAALMYCVSWFGYSPQNLIMPLVLAALIAVRGLWVEALWILGSQASGPLVMVLKDLIHRPRPSPELVGVLTPLSDPSFPSGHVVQYATLFGVTFFLAYVLMQRSTPRTIVLILLALPIILVGPSRLYLGQHWLSDVLGGYAVSFMLLIPYCWAYAKWRLAATRRRFARGPATHDQRRAETRSSQRGETNQAPGSARG